MMKPFFSKIAKQQKRAEFDEYVSFTDDYAEKLRSLIQKRWHDIWKQVTEYGVSDVANFRDDLS
ncbi:MAG: hypothetical protein IGS39_00775 [Calothrix sp. C42_A2020_038]|nr:hypothetical protein [Calothrix sp. C42_A2020_038]